MFSARPSPRSLRAIAALLLPLILISCTSTGANKIIPRALPEKPAWAVPVAVQRPAEGTDLLEIAKREQNARKQANAIIVKFGTWYDERRVEFGANP